MLPGLYCWQGLLRISKTKLLSLLILTFLYLADVDFFSLPVFLMELEISMTFLFTS